MSNPLLFGTVRTGFNAIGALVLLLIAKSAFADLQEPPLRTDLHEQVVMVPMPLPIGHVNLETTVFRPDGAGPFPLVVINHGLDSGSPAFQVRTRYPAIAQEFLKRGYAVVLPMRRGFSKSEGVLIDTGCSYSANGRAGAKDIEGVIGWLRQQSWADASRILVVGQSHGGLASLALAEDNVPGVKAILNFAGGLHGGGADDCHWESALKSAFSTYGSDAKIESMWFYGSNDRLFEPSLVQQLYRRYTEAGGKAELIDYGAFGVDAHGMFGTQTGFDTIWWPKAKPFLASHGLPVEIVHPDLYGGLPVPSASGFAGPHDVAAVPLVSNKCRDSYGNFFDRAPNPKAFAISEDGHCGWASDYGEASFYALNACAQLGKPGTCRLYRVNDNVVWPMQ